MSTPPDLPLHVISETAETITLGWNPVDGAVGYEFFADDHKSSTMDPNRTRVRFGKNYKDFRVAALSVEAEGHWPTTPVPPDPPSKMGVLGCIIGAGNNIALAKTLKKLPVFREDSITQQKVQLAKDTGALFIGLATGKNTAQTMDLVRQWPTITTWELDNEPYYANVVLANWAKMMEATATAIKQAHPEYKTCLPLYVQSDNGDYFSDGRWSPWVDQIFAAAPGLKGSIIDRYSMHPYASPRNAAPDFKVIDRVVGQLKSHGAMKPLDFSEWGYSVGSGSQQVTEDKQATYSEQFITMARARGDVQNIIHYCLEGWGTDFEPAFGLFGPGGKRRKVVDVYDRMVGV